VKITDIIFFPSVWWCLRKDYRAQFLLFFFFLSLSIGDLDNFSFFQCFSPLPPITKPPLPSSIRLCVFEVVESRDVFLYSCQRTRLPTRRLFPAKVPLLLGGMATAFQGEHLSLLCAPPFYGTSFFMVLRIHSPRKANFWSHFAGPRYPVVPPAIFF